MAGRSADSKTRPDEFSFTTVLSPPPYILKDGLLYRRVQTVYGWRKCGESWWPRPKTAYGKEATVTYRRHEDKEIELDVLGLVVDFLATTLGHDIPEQFPVTAFETGNEVVWVVHKLYWWAVREI